ncbi:MAG: ParB/RepB/Spo0J family partition protein [Acidobacteriia bacterium]|nr:ParB/RepB/Spo0J family partition protein [Terriglobia bacterium]
MTRKALGRGLSALLRDVEAPSAVGLELVPVEQIEPNPLQPRRSFPDATLKELADSMRASGLVQPILVRRAGERYQLVVGERRWRAAKLAGIEAVPAVIRDLGDRESLELALTENLLREDLNPLDAARGLRSLQENFGLTHEEIAARLGVDRSTVTNSLRLLRLPEEVQSLLAEGKITAGHARALLAVDSPAEQVRLARLIADKGFSVREAEAFATRKAPPSEAAPEAEKLDPNVRAAVLELERTLGTRVKIVGSPESGRIEIRYYSPEDLNRIFEWITRR